MAKKQAQVGTEIKTFTILDISRGIKKLKRRIEQLRELDPSHISYNDQEVRNIELQIHETILDVFGPSSPQFHSNQYYEIWEGSHIIGDSESSQQRKFAAGIPQAITMLVGLIAQLEEKKNDLEIDRPIHDIKAKDNNQRIFIVHGRDEAHREKVARFVQKIGLNPIILHEQPNSGQTIIEKFEKNSDVGYAIVILSADDLGSYKDDLSGDISKLTFRSRQNVVFELGYFIGKLTRTRVCALYEQGVEVPSDIHGVVYIPLDEGGGWQLKIYKELHSLGYQIDISKAI